MSVRRCRPLPVYPHFPTSFLAGPMIYSCTEIVFWWLFYYLAHLRESAIYMFNHEKRLEQFASHASIHNGVIDLASLFVYGKHRSQMFALSTSTSLTASSFLDHCSLNCKMSWNLEATRYEFRIPWSLWNLTGASIALLQRCFLISQRYHHFSTHSPGFLTSRDPIGRRHSLWCIKVKVNVMAMVSIGITGCHCVFFYEDMIFVVV